MKKQIVAFLTACLLIMPLTACGGGSTSTSSTSSDTTAAATASSDFDAVNFYYGQWRGSVEISGTSIYGTTSGSEQMLDVYLNQDGTCSVEPLAAHADLLTDTGTWEATDKNSVTLKLDKAGEVKLTVTESSNVSATTMSANAADFEIADFETIDFVLY